jgi:hypothetical protein
VQLRLGHRLDELVQDDAGVELPARDASGRAYRLRARYVLGCDGASGPVRGQIGAGFVGHFDPRPNFNLVFRAAGLETRLGPAVQYWVLGERVSGLIGRLDLAGTWWAILPGVEAAYGARHAGELIAALAGGPVEHEVLATDPWTARMLIADRFQDRRVFLVGESAHVNPPWGGHGFNTSVGDAVNIAWKIAAVEHGWAPPELLETYEGERRGVVEQTVASARENLQALAGDLAPDALAVQRAKRSEFHSLGLVLGYTYADSPISQPNQHANSISPREVCEYTPSTEPGARLPHAWLPDGASLYDRLGQGFTLLGPEQPNPSRLQRHAQSLGIPLAVLAPPEPYPWREQFLLVRPDQHIAWRSTDPGEIDIAHAAGRTLAAPAQQVPARSTKESR